MQIGMMVYDLLSAFERSGDMPLLRERVYTIEDIYALPEGERAELIDGHYIESNKGKCEVFAAPFAVYLDEKTNTYVEPDVSVICDPDKLDDRGCKGAPDWIIEIVSPASRRMDYYTKLFKYRTAGVREYWIVDPVKKLVMVYDFENEDTEQYTFQDSIKVGIYEELRIDFAEM